MAVYTAITVLELYYSTSKDPASVPVSVLLLELY